MEPFLVSYECLHPQLLGSWRNVPIALLFSGLDACLLWRPPSSLSHGRVILYRRGWGWAGTPRTDRGRDRGSSSCPAKPSRTEAVVEGLACICKLDRFCAAAAAPHFLRPATESDTASLTQTEKGESRTLRRLQSGIAVVYSSFSPPQSIQHPHQKRTRRERKFLSFLKL